MARKRIRILTAAQKLTKKFRVETGYFRRKLQESRKTLRAHRDLFIKLVEYCDLAGLEWTWADFDSVFSIRLNYNEADKIALGAICNVCGCGYDITGKYADSDGKGTWMSYKMKNVPVRVTMHGCPLPDESDRCKVVQEVRTVTNYALVCGV